MNEEGKEPKHVVERGFYLRLLSLAANAGCICEKLKSAGLIQPCTQCLARREFERIVGAKTW